MKPNLKQNQKCFKTSSVNQLISKPAHFSLPPFKLSKSEYRISIRDPVLCRGNLTNSEEIQESVTAFKNSMKKKVLNLKMKNNVKLLQTMKHE